MANVFEDSVGMFNFRRIFPRAPGPAQEVPRNAWGQFIKLENVIVDSAKITVTTRWAADTFLTRSQRDSLTTFNLQRTDKSFWPVQAPSTRPSSGQRPLETRSARLDDRQEGGRKFAIRTLSLDESDPPFSSATPGLHTDSGRFDLGRGPHLRAAGSAGNMVGRCGGGTTNRRDRPEHPR